MKNTNRNDPSNNSRYVCYDNDVTTRKKKNEEDDQSMPKSATSSSSLSSSTLYNPFVTTADVMEYINESIRGSATTTIHNLPKSSTSSSSSATCRTDSTPHDQQSPVLPHDDDERQNPPHRHDESDHDMNGQFILQKKLPNGTYRNAYSDEVRDLSFQQKLQQAIEYVQKMSSLSKQIQWCHQQRLLGNQYYHNQQYYDAIDIYVTCCIIAQPSLQLSSPEKNKNDVSSSDNAMIKEEEDVSMTASSTTQNEQNDAKQDEAAPGENGEMSLVPVTKDVSMDNDNKYRHHLNHENNTDNNTDTNSDNNHQNLDHERWLLFLKVMNNLAQCTNQLSQYQKTIHFVSIALQQYHDHFFLHNDLHTNKNHNINNNNNNVECQTNNDETNNHDDVDQMITITDHHPSHQQQQAQSRINDEYYEWICKLYYKRGKAYRLRGEYTLSSNDLKESLGYYHRMIATISTTIVVRDEECHNDSASDNDRNHNESYYDNMKQSIDKEIILLQKAIKTSKQNKKKQTQNMKRLLVSSSPPDSNHTEPSITTYHHRDDVDDANNLSTSSPSMARPLYEAIPVNNEFDGDRRDAGKGIFSVANHDKKRKHHWKQYSTLRASRNHNDTSSFGDFICLDDDDDDIDHENDRNGFYDRLFHQTYNLETLSYNFHYNSKHCWIYILRWIGYIAQTLLYWIGEGDDDDDDDDDEANHMDDENDRVDAGSNEEDVDYPNSYHSDYHEKLD